MFWRPENWINPYRIGSVTGTTQRELGFEEGADAMLKALIAQPGTRAIEPMQFINVTLGRKGWQVFIPEKK